VAWIRLKRAAIIIGLGLTTSTRPVHAEERARLVYVRDESATQCPSEADLRLRVIARLGYDPFSPRASQVVLARIEALDGALNGSVELIDRTGISGGKRSLTVSDADCDELSRGLALSISLTLDADRETPAPAVATPPAAIEVPARREQPASRSSERSAARRPPQWFLGAAFTSAVGALPAPGLGGSFVLGVRRQFFSVALEGRAIQSFARELSPRGELSGRLLAPGVSGCGLWRESSVCLVGLLGAQTLRSRGVLQPRSSTGAFASAGLRLEQRIPLAPEHVAMTFGVAGLVNLSRNTAGFSGGEVWKMPPVSGYVEFGVVAPFL
jgi:hypothetical protein